MDDRLEIGAEFKREFGVPAYGLLIELMKDDRDRYLKAVESIRLGRGAAVATALADWDEERQQSWRSETH